MHAILSLGRYHGSVFAALALLASAPVFHADVLPILQRRCQTCHRPGEAAPMPLLTFEQTRPWAKSIREAVRLKRMPPWHADPAYGKFRNDLSMTFAEIETLIAWVDAGAQEGNRSDAPPAREFVNGWRIAKPDVVFQIPRESNVPASGTLEYVYLSVPTGFTEDRWVEMAEVRPSNRSVVHHAIVYVKPPASDGWFSARQYLAGYAPGMSPQIWKPGQARLVPAGSDLVFQLHYTVSGKAATDRTEVGMVFARKPPSERVMAMSTGNHWLEIPPGANDHQVDSSVTMPQDVTLVAMRPHMHLRGKAFEFRAVYPTGEAEVLLRVPRYDFNWQPYYYLDKPRPLPRGTRIECTARYDNSPNNPRNPDPTATVRWGEQSWEEMMLGWFDVTVPVASR